MTKKRTQLILMVTVFIITSSIVVLSTTFSYTSLREQMIAQMLQVNRTMGEHLFQLFSDELLHEKAPEEQIAFLQKLSDGIEFPNGGFICALAEGGEVVAFPGLKAGDKMSIGGFTIHDEDGDYSGTFSNLDTPKVFKGFLRQPNQEEQIIYSRPLEDTPLRLNVHQNMKSINSNIRTLLFPSLIIGLTLSILGSLLVYFLSNRIVVAYESRLEHLNSGLMEMNKERKQLLRVITHDISNPLSVIEMATSLTEIEEIEKEELRESFQMIKASVRQAVDIINLNRDILAIEDKKKRLSIQEVSVKESVQEMLQLLQHKLDDKDIALDVSIEEGLTVMVEPVSFLNSVLNNVMTNAVKFSFPHSTILLTARSDGEYGHVAIKDTGIGMSQELLATLFHPQEKTSRKGTDDEIGTGFGMPIMKRFVELYGGNISVESIEGKEGVRIHGTTFHIRVPRKT